MVSHCIAARHVWLLAFVALLLVGHNGATQVAERVSVSSAGSEANDESWHSAVSSDGGLVAFDSAATNLIADDTNSDWDVFVRERGASRTARVSISSAGQESTYNSWLESISANGRWVTFTSDSGDLAPGSTTGTGQVYLHDRDLGTTVIVSVSTGGEVGNGLSCVSHISPDGRYVVFRSVATDLVSEDANGCQDVFIRDTALDTTSLVSLSSTGVQANGHCYAPCVSSDGRYVAFGSAASNLVSDDTNGQQDIFLRDMELGTTERLSVSSAGTQSDGMSRLPCMSASGRHVAFYSAATNLVSSDGNAQGDVFVRDTELGATERASVSNTGAEADGASSEPSISADGRFVVFDSWARNLVATDTNLKKDIFVRDRLFGKTARVSDTSAGDEANGSSYEPSISADGSTVAFNSHATNLVVGETDTNGEKDVLVALNPLATPCPPEVTWLKGPGYDGTDGCDPDSGDALDTLFKFKCRLTDADGDEPDYVRLVLYRNGKLYKKLAMNPGATSTADGRKYARNLRLSAGNWEYRIAAKDGDGTDTTEWCTGPVIESGPHLDWAGTSGYTSDGVAPDSGQPNSTTFVFKVKYLDHDGDMPTFVKVRIIRDGVSYKKKAMATSDSSPDPTKGIVYEYQTQLPTGTYEYRFLGADDDGKAGGPAREKKSGPTIDDGGTALVISSLSAMPTAKGAQVTFSLSAPASVQARVLNLAGRPVKTLCTARSCEAGANTLVWNATSDAGVTVPRGTYLIEVTARTEGGGEARALVRVVVGW